MLFDDPSVSVTDTGKVMEKLALGSPLTSNVAGLPEPVELIVAPPVAVRVPEADSTTVPATELEEISPKTSPLRVLMLMVLTMLALTVAFAVAAWAVLYTAITSSRPRQAIATFLAKDAGLAESKFTFIINRIVLFTSNMRYQDEVLKLLD